MGFLKIACLVLLAACAASSQSADEATCGIYADSLAHPVDCNKYYILTLHSCPEGLYFNATTDQCDLPQNTRCGQTSTTEEIPTEASSTSAPPTSTTTSPNSSSTTTPTSSTTTPTSTATSTTSSTPVSTTVTSASTTSGTTQAPTNGCPAVDDSANRVRFSHETNCNLYYLCTNGDRVLYQCTNSNHFNPTKKVCRPVNEAGCDQCPDVPVEGEVVRLPHESVCDYYYRCNAEGTSLYSCPEGQHFSRAERSCVDIADAGCTLDDLVVTVPIY